MFNRKKIHPKSSIQERRQNPRRFSDLYEWTMCWGAGSGSKRMATSSQAVDGEGDASDGYNVA